MKPPPRDPWALQDRIMSAVCDDLFNMAQGKPGGRFNALRAATIADRREAECDDGEMKRD